jgi:hypothetical protein
MQLISIFCLHFQNIVKVILANIYEYNRILYSDQFESLCSFDHYTDFHLVN